MENESTKNYQASRIHRDARHIKYLLETKRTQTQNTGYHLDVQHFLWKLVMQQAPYGTNGNNYEGLVYTWENPPSTHVMLCWYLTL